MRLLLRTVRLRYIYICGASALLSATLLFVVYHMLRLAHHHILAETTWITRVMHWLINHIGTTPLVILIGGGLFTLFFWIRSQKIADDLKVIGCGTHEMANGQIPAPIEVLNGGELRQIAADLNEVALRMQAERLSISDHEWIDREPRRDEGLSTDLPTKLTLYGVRSSLDTIMEGRCRDEAEIQHWVRLAYEQTLRLELALDSREMRPEEHLNSIPPVYKDSKC
ncbi:hypothetical protein [Paenibacillus sp. QZ-Y1]|uniref:hypothetical protein n=1 Tax=Paenibacillus sp. QZ-Y1 TaxID=3414511 RepID=UPI003F79F3C7